MKTINSTPTLNRVHYLGCQKVQILGNEFSILVPSSKLWFRNINSLDSQQITSFSTVNRSRPSKPSLTRRSQSLSSSSKDDVNGKAYVLLLLKESSAAGFTDTVNRGIPLTHPRWP